MAHIFTLHLLHIKLKHKYGPSRQNKCAIHKQNCLALQGITFKKLRKGNTKLFLIVQKYCPTEIKQNPISVTITKQRFLNRKCVFSGFKKNLAV